MITTPAERLQLLALEALGRREYEAAAGHFKTRKLFLRGWRPKVAARPAKQMALPIRDSYFDPEAKGLISFIDPEEVAYREVMGRPSPEPFPEGTVAHDQWSYRNKGSGDPTLMARRDAKPKRKKATPARRARKPVGA